MSAAPTLYSIKDVARAVLGNDACPGIKLPLLESVTRIALFGVLGRNAAFSEEGNCRIDLGNGFVMTCTVQPIEAGS